MPIFIQKWGKPTKFNMNKEEIKSIHDIVIIQADKVKKDPTAIIKTEINEKITKMLEQNKITDHNKYYLTSFDDLPKIRGPLKLHKIDTPMRIVTCSRDTITSPISQFVFRIIKELRTTLTGVVYNTSNFIITIAHVK
ncbi:unnamed protein product [Rotaria magnacalcarata]|nr:unnamed protein product [Rotaria magnacalcarata]CAF2221035.1 unnamed protein product [Rotaria magnacalcarata]